MDDTTRNFPDFAATAVPTTGVVPAASVGAEYTPPVAQHLPTMAELDQFAAELDEVDRTLAELDA